MIAPEISAEMAGLIPQGRLETIEGVGHLSNLEAPEAFDAALLEHLRGLRHPLSGPPAGPRGPAEPPVDSVP